MSGVADSSSMNGSLLPTIQTRFNVSKEADILLLLRLIHRSPLAVEDKNTLRDAIFAYKIDKVTTDFATVQKLFAEHSITLVQAADVEEGTSVAAPQKSSSQAPYGFTRQTPVFGSVATPTTATAAASPAQPEPIPVATATQPESTAVNSQTAAPAASAEPQTESTVANDTATASAPAVASDAVNKIPITVAKSETPTEQHAAPAPTRTVTEKSADTTPVPKPVEHTHTDESNPDASARIKEIKHEVNAAVGNPISLIDMDDAVGREYMAALLDAMKRVSVEATSEAAARAMSRLEKAFQAVQSLLANSDTKTQSTTTHTAAEPVVEHQSADAAAQSSAPAPTTAESSEPSATSETDATSEPIQADPQSEPEPQPEPEPTKDNEASVPPAPELSVVAEPAQSPTEPEPSEPEPSSMESDAKPLTAVAPVAEMEAAAKNADDDTTEPEAPAASAQSSTISSPASEKKLATLLKEKQAAAAAKRPKPTGDPLMSEDVSRGLAQLLSEWSIFKRSGMFGTGPNGIEHPLYEKLAQLTMSSVLTGRFEGVTPEVKRSINDYMNGWRYEEGILHESGETFERYLRRVVLHILEKRKKIVDEQK